MASQSCLRLCIVDPEPRDYLSVAALASRRSFHFHLVKDGRSALRMDRTYQIDVWLINVSLPDMSGFDLHEMLVERRHFAFVALVDDHYSDQHERRARSSGAKLYVCKPPQIWWLDLLAHPPPRQTVS